jgi:hypothetical protein
MGTITEYTPDRELVPLKNKKADYSFHVRGLTFVDVSTLVNMHLNDVEAAYALYERASTAIMSDMGYETLAMTLVQGAPGLTAEVISMAADDLDNAQQYAKLPFSVTVLAVEKIARLTLQDAGGLKNLAAMVEKAKAQAEAVRNAQSGGQPPLSQDQPQSNVSSGTSENP